MHHINFFVPQFLSRIYDCPGVHISGVSSLCNAAICGTGGLITGGVDGEVRTWRGSDGGGGRGKKPTLLVTVREHKKEVTSLQVTRDQRECISASMDGSCIIWSLEE